MNLLLLLLLLLFVIVVMFVTIAVITIIRRALYREAESYVSHHQTCKHQCRRLGSVPNRILQTYPEADLSL